MKLIKQADLKRRMVVLVTALAAVAAGLVLSRIHRRTALGPALKKLLGAPVNLG